MGPRGRGSGSRGSRGSRGGSRGSSRGRGRGASRGRRGRGVRGGRQNGSIPSRNGFRTSRTDEAQNASDSENHDSVVEGDELDDIDAGSPEDEQSAGSEDDAPPQRSYSSLLSALNANDSATTEPPKKKRKLADDETNGSVDEATTKEQSSTEQEDGVVEAGLTEEVADDDDALDSDNEDMLLHDPFEKHYVNINDNEKDFASAMVAVDEKQKTTRKLTVGDEGMRKMVTTYGHQDTLAPERVSDKNLRLKQRLSASGSRVYKTLTAEEKDVAREILSYRDVQHGHRTVQNASRFRDITCLHTLNHILKTRDRVLKNNAKASKDDLDESLDLRDQGFTRPKVLIIVPTKQACVRFIHSIVDISEPDQQENKSRFLETYSADDDGTWQDKPEDFQELFGGNHEEDFRVGLKFTRKTIKYFSGFYNSDVIFGSALGLMRTITTGGGGTKDKKKGHDADFLSSIEVVIVDNASAIQMQNWQHLEYVFTQLNLLPKDSHGCDFSRVRNTYLDGKSRYLRQTILLTSHHTPEINSLMSTHTYNIAGLAKYTPTYAGPLRSLLPTLPFTPPQIFLRFNSPDPTTDPDTRFTHFTTTILPSLIPSSRSSSKTGSQGTLLYIPSYADFIRLRNHLSTSPTTTSLSFGTISEYTPHRDVARARSHFMTGRHSLLVYTERAHHHFRYKLKGVKRIVFYGIPENEVFWGEVVAMLGYNMGEGDDAARSQKRNVRALFSRWDALKLERVVGTERVTRLIGEKGGDVFEFV